MAYFENISLLEFGGVKAILGFLHRGWVESISNVTSYVVFEYILIVGDLRWYHSLP